LEEAMTDARAALAALLMDWEREQREARAVGCHAFYEAEADRLAAFLLARGVTVAPTAGEPAAPERTDEENCERCCHGTGRHTCPKGGFVVPPRAPSAEWRKCPSHPDVNGATMWGCPDCLAELRRQVRAVPPIAGPWLNVDALTDEQLLTLRDMGPYTDWVQAMRRSLNRLAAGGRT
jgi:hypothetical protein